MDIDELLAKYHEHFVKKYFYYKVCQKPNYKAINELLKDTKAFLKAQIEKLEDK